MYLPMIIGILVLAAIAGGYGIYDDKRIKKRNEEIAAQEKQIAEETMKAFHAEEAMDIAGSLQRRKGRPREFRLPRQTHPRL